MLALMGLLPASAQVTGKAQLQECNVIGLPESDMRYLRGLRIGMIFQEPAAALNPVRTIGAQVAESLIVHDLAHGESAQKRAVELLALVGLPDPTQRAKSYPHQLSGGQRQRAMIAAALAAEPALLIADEPTTALDVTVQAQILELLLDLRAKTNMAMIIVSHDLGVLAQVADEILVMYAGRAVEQASTEKLFSDPRHPYTQALLATQPRLERRAGKLPVIPGQVPDLRHPPGGCLFAPRCPLASCVCHGAEPEWRIWGNRSVACFKADMEW